MWCTETAEITQDPAGKFKRSKVRTAGAKGTDGNWKAKPWKIEKIKWN